MRCYLEPSFISGVQHAGITAADDYGASYLDGYTATPGLVGLKDGGYIAAVNNDGLKDKSTRVKKPGTGYYIVVTGDVKDAGYHDVKGVLPSLYADIPAKGAPHRPDAGYAELKGRNSYQEVNGLLHAEVNGGNGTLS